MFLKLFPIKRTKGEANMVCLTLCIVEKDLYYQLGFWVKSLLISISVAGIGQR